MKPRLGSGTAREATGAARANRIQSVLVDIRRQCQGRPILAWRRVFGLAWLAYGRTLLGLDVSMRRRVPASELALDIVIPVGERDLGVLPSTIEGLRRYLKHPIGRIYVVGRPTRSVEGLCDHMAVSFVDEADATRVRREQLQYKVGGVDRSGWLLQQFVKLSGDEIARSEAFLVADADTVLLRPQVFEHRGKLIFNHSVEYHHPYFAAYRKLLGAEPPSALSYVSHGMVFKKGTLKHLKKTLELRHGKPWERAILDTLDFDTRSNFSEYELYGNFYMSLKLPISHAYWHNVSLPREDLEHLTEVRSRWEDRRKSASFHDYGPE